MKGVFKYSNGSFLEFCMGESVDYLYLGYKLERKNSLVLKRYSISNLQEDRIVSNIIKYINQIRPQTYIELYPISSKINHIFLKSNFQQFN